MTALDRPAATCCGPSGRSARTRELLELAWREHGDVVVLIPTPPTYLVTHPDDVRHVLQVNHRGYGKDTIQYRNLALVTGHGLLAADTEPWRRQRKAVQPAFRSAALTRVASTLPSPPPAWPAVGVRCRWAQSSTSSTT